jgi:hypothetical protein
MGNVKLSIYSTKNIVEYKGRMLGLVKPEDFVKFLGSKNNLSRLYTSSNALCEEIACRNEVKNLRLALTVKDKNGVGVYGRTIFFSEPLDMISEIGDKKLSLVGINETFYEIEEG